MFIIDQINVSVKAPDTADDAQIEAQIAKCEELEEVLEAALQAYLSAKPFPAGWTAEVKR